MRVERDKINWLEPGLNLRASTSLPSSYTRTAQWWVTFSLTCLDDTRRPAFRRLPFACTVACLDQVVRAVDDWLAGFDRRGERLVSEVEELEQVLEMDTAANDLQPATVARIRELSKEMLDFVRIRSIAADTRGTRQKTFNKIIQNQWGCHSEEEAAKVGPGRLSGLAAELLDALVSSDEYMRRVQNQLAEVLAATDLPKSARYWTEMFLRTLQVLGHSTTWLQGSVERASRLVASDFGTDISDSLAKAFPTVIQQSSNYEGIFALEPLSDHDVTLPHWMQAIGRETAESRVDDIESPMYKDQARRYLLGEKARAGQRRFFLVAHRDVHSVASTPRGRYTDQFDAAQDIAAAVTSTLQNYWAGNPRRDLWMTQSMLICIPGVFNALVRLDWREMSEEYPVSGLYELPEGIEPVFHWAHQSYEIRSPEASFLCAWIAAEKLVTRALLRQSSGRDAADALMIEFITPILLFEEIASRLSEVCIALHELKVCDQPRPAWLVKQLMDAASLEELLARCAAVPYLHDEVQEVSRCLCGASDAAHWLDAKEAEIRRNLHRMKRLRNQIVHNAELDRGAATFLSNLLADYARIAAYRTSSVVRLNQQGFDAAFAQYRRQWREFRAKLDNQKDLDANVWLAVLRLS